MAAGQQRTHRNTARESGLLTYVHNHPEEGRGTKAKAHIPLQTHQSRDCLPQKHSLYKTMSWATLCCCCGLYVVVIGWRMRRTWGVHFCSFVIWSRSAVVRSCSGVRGRGLRVHQSLLGAGVLPPDVQHEDRGDEQ